jgi:hypothetical protein
LFIKTLEIHKFLELDVDKGGLSAKTRLT